MAIGRDKMVGGSARLVARRKRVGSLPFRSASAGSLADPKVWRVGVRYLKRRDGVLARIISGTGPLRFELDDDHYEAIVGSIIFQQLAGSAARAILDRFKGLYGGRLPSPREYLSTDIDRLRKAGLSPQKISYIRDLAERLMDGRLDLKRLEGLSDEEAMRELDAVRGIGRWTAEMFLIFKLGRTDVLPVDDLGLRKAAKRAYRLRKLPSRERFERLAVNWHPYSSISTLYLWRSTEKPEAPAKW
ncbi:DNA-3-methyladenine glycosylase 2 family protein, partial [Candidatus Bathyarchaeota archaeon]